MVAILEHMSALSDPIRCRMLMLLEKQELTVTEIGSVLQMPQSSVSRHLKTLADDNWVMSRRDGTSRFYAMSTGDELDPGARGLWQVMRDEVARTSAARARCAGASPGEVGRVLRVRRGRLGSTPWRSLRGYVLPLGRARLDRPGS